MDRCKSIDPVVTAYNPNLVGRSEVRNESIHIVK